MNDLDWQARRYQKHIMKEAGIDVSVEKIKKEALRVGMHNTPEDRAAHYLTEMMPKEEGDLPQNIPALLIDCKGKTEEQIKAELTEAIREQKLNAQA